MSVPQLCATAALLGAGTMVLEIGLTRLFSVLLFYHYVFLVLGVALLGLGLGGALVSLVPDRARRASEYAAGTAVLAVVATLAVSALSVWVLPVGAPILHGTVAVAPFLFVGMALPLLFIARPAASAQIYGADLAGAALGAIIVFGLLYLGAITAVLGAAALFAGAAWVIGRTAPHGGVGRTVLVGLLVALFALNATLQLVDVDLGRLAAGKPLGQWLEHGQASVVRTTWDPFGRVDVVRSPRTPLERFVFIDGAAGSPLPRYPADANQETQRRMELGAFPYQLVDAERVLIVGSGGGIGVLYALLAGIEDVTAVEVSRGVIDAVRAEGDYAGYLYDREEVRVVEDEGRSFLDRDDGRYDVIDLSLVVSLASAHGGYALTENYLFTQEAFASVFDHLTDTGIAAVRLYDDPTLTRAFVTAAAAIRKTAESDAEAVRHLAVVFNPKEADQAGATFYPLLLVSKRAMTEAASRELTSRAENLGYTVMFAPFTHEDGAFGKVARGEASLDQIQNELEGGVFTPPTDARPFFFEMTDGLPRQLVHTWFAVAVVVALATVGLAVVMRSAAPSPSARALGPPLAYFAAIGIAFMLVEISILARLNLFLGHPTVAVTVGLAALLLASGVGSLLSGRTRVQALGQAIAFAAVGAAVLAIAAPLALEGMRSTAGDLPLPGRIAVAVATIWPLGMMMGVLFPSGLRLASMDATLPWAVNGVASVVGAVLATTLALELGYLMVSITGAAVYAGLAVVGHALLGEGRLVGWSGWRISKGRQGDMASAFPSSDG